MPVSATKERTEMLGLKPCPFCGEEKELRVQTPACEDGIVRDAYIRCFVCGKGATLFVSVPQSECGELPFAPIAAKWNDRKSPDTDAPDAEAEADFRQMEFPVPVRMAVSDEELLSLR
jgi:hypothetical protein